MSVWGRPVLLGVVNNLCPMPVLYSNIDPDTGVFSTDGENTHMATSYYIPVDYTANSQYTLSWNRSVMPSATRIMVFAYNTNKEFLARSAGNSDNPRILSASDFRLSPTSATGDPAFLRVRVYNSTFSENRQNLVHLMLVPGGTAAAYRQRSIEYIS